jgi:hypothetical protein
VTDFLVLHALRIRGVADQDGLARSTGLATAAVAAIADHLTESGLAVRRTGRFAGWALTGPGRQCYESRLADERARVGADTALGQAYDGFVALNEQFKSVCTAWQVRDLDAQLMNDHEDPAYDASVVGRLGAVHHAVLPVIGQLAGALPRFGGYRDRLDDSYRRVTAGQRDAFTRPLSESYHDVWMELHQDLLLTMNISREAAGGSSV